MLGHDTAKFTMLYLILLSLWFHELFKLIFLRQWSWPKTMYTENWRELAWGTFLRNFPILLVQHIYRALMKSCLLEYGTVFPIKNKFQPVILTFLFWFSSAILLSKMKSLFLNFCASPLWVTLLLQVLINTGNVY